MITAKIQLRTKLKARVDKISCETTQKKRQIKSLSDSITELNEMSTTATNDEISVDDDDDNNNEDANEDAEELPTYGEKISKYLDLFDTPIRRLTNQKEEKEHAVLQFRNEPTVKRAS